MADIDITQGESVPITMKTKYEDMGDGTHALVISFAGTVHPSRCWPARSTSDRSAARASRSSPIPPSRLAYTRLATASVVF